MTKIDILLATYDGEKYLKQQLDSLLAQTYENIRIIIRDDASQDGTKEIIQEYGKRYPNKIYPLFGKERLGVKANFSKLMEVSSSPYVMFADQDDIWMSSKVEQTLACMHS